MNSRPEVLETRQLLAADAFSPRDLEVLGRSQFGPGSAVVSGSKFLGMDFQSPRWSVDAFDDFTQTGVRGDFQIGGKAGFDVGYFVNSGAMDIHYGEVGLTQSYPDPHVSGAFGRNGLPVSLDAAYGAGSYVETSSPSFGAYADVVFNVATAGSITGKAFGVGGDLNLSSQLVDIHHELVSFNRGNNGTLSVLGMALPMEAADEASPGAGFEASVPLGKAELVMSAEADPSGVEADVRLEVDPAKVVKKLKSLKKKNKLPPLGVGVELARLKLGIPNVTVRGDQPASGSFNGQLSAASEDALNEDNTVLDLDANLGLRDVTFDVGPVSMTVTPIVFTAGPEIYAVQTLGVTPVHRMVYEFNPPASGSLNGQRFENRGTIRFQQGDDLRLDFYGTPIDVTSTWEASALVTNDIDLKIDVSGDLIAGDFELDIDLPAGARSLLGLPFEPPPLLHRRDVLKLDVAKLDVFQNSFEVPLQTSTRHFTVGADFEFDLSVDCFAEDCGDGQSLRDAILNANAKGSGTDEEQVIYLAHGRYELELNQDGTRPDDETGDLDIVRNQNSGGPGPIVRIVGVSAEATTIDANGIDRVFDVHPGATLILENVTITGGEVEGADGGGVRSRGTLELRNVTVEGNIANTETRTDGSSFFVDKGRGGGIAQLAGSTMIVDSTVRNNTQYDRVRGAGGDNRDGGGGIAVATGTFNAMRSTVYGNESNRFGSAILIDRDATFSLTSSTVSLNEGAGEAISVLGGVLDVRSSTIAGNSANVAIDGRANGSLTIQDTIVADSTVVDVDIPRSDIIDNGFNVVETPASSSQWDANKTTTGVDPNLTELGAHGGSSWTMLPLPAAGSPVIGRGSVDAAGRDQRGFTFFRSPTETPARTIGAVQSSAHAVIPPGAPNGLREAIHHFNHVGGSNTIRLQHGVYAPDRQARGTDLRGALSHGLDIRGQSLTILGEGIADGHHGTTIDGQLFGFRVFTVDSDATLNLESLTVSGGTSVVDHAHGRGAGVFVDGALNLDDVRITGNHSPFGVGGGISGTENSTINVVDSQIDRNTGPIGGGIYSGGNLQIHRSSLTENSAAPGYYLLPSEFGADGGAIYSVGTTAIYDSLISGNTSIARDGNSPDDTTVLELDDGGHARGAGLFAAGGTVTLRNSTISGNVAYGGQGGHGLKNSSGGAREAFAGGDGHGAGVFVDAAADVTAGFLTITGNSAFSGKGGMAEHNGNIIVGADGTARAGGVMSVGDFTVTNSVIAKNGISDSTDDIQYFDRKDVDGTFSSQGHNFVGVARSNAGFRAALGDQYGIVTEVDLAHGTDVSAYELDPKLGPLSYNGGATLTHLPLPGSPLIDAGHGSGQDADQRGVSRGIGLGNDIGAVEQDALFVTSFHDDLNALSLRKAVSDAIELSRAGRNPEILLPAGTFKLTEGALQVPEGGVVRLVGAGAGKTIIDAGDLDSAAFDVLAGGGLALKHVTVRGAIGSEGDHARLLTNRGFTDILDSHLTGSRGGTAVDNQAGALLYISRTALTDNHSDVAGGAVRNEGQLFGLNLTFAGNVAPSGAAILNVAGSARLESLTVANNTGGVGTGGVLVEDGSVHIEGSILASNTGGDDPDVSGSISSGGENLIGNPGGAVGFGSNDLLNTDPKLLPLIQAPLPHFPLQLSSPAFERRSPVNANNTDMLGNPRTLGARSDIGAIEQVVLHVTSSQDTMSPGTLRYAINTANQLPGSDLISFDSSTDTNAIVLGEEILIEDDVTIRGNGATHTEISGGHLSRIFQVSDFADAGRQVNGDVVLAGLKLSDGAGFIGGAVSSQTSGRLTLEDVFFKNNTSERLAGAVYAQGGELRVTGSTFEDNTAGHHGGAIFAENTTLNVNNSTFSGNVTTSDGGAVYALQSESLLSHVTIASNSAGGDGGGIAVSHAGGGSLTLINSIVADNVSARPDLAALADATVVSHHSLIGDNTGSGLTASSATAPDAHGNMIGSSTSPIAPRLRGLNRFGGRTRTRELIRNSPAVDAGAEMIVDEEGVLIYVAPESDQRGFLRQDGAVDIGASELQVVQNYSVAHDADVEVSPVGSQRTRITVTQNDGTESEIIGNPAERLNFLPWAEPIAVQTVQEDATSAHSVRVTIGDLDDSVDSLVLTATSSHPSLIPNENIEIVGTGRRRTLRFRPAPDAFTDPATNGDEVTITVSIDDGDGVGGTTFPVEITPLPDAPTADSREYPMPRNSSITSRLTGRDVDGEPVTYVITDTSDAHGVVELIDAETGKFRYAPDTGFRGTSSFTFQTYDGEHLSDPARLTFNVASGSVLTVRGTSEGESIQVEENPTEIEVTVDGHAYQIPVADVTTVNVRAGGGDDDVRRLGGVSVAVRMHGDEGNDTLIGNAGDDSIRGNAGNDWIDAGDGANRVWSAGGEDTVLTGSGNDFISLGSQNDYASAGHGDDEIRGGNQSDLIDAGAGNDTAVGGRGRDTIFGSFGDDDLRGDNGDDILSGGAGRDVLAGHSGRDLLVGDLGRDVLKSGADEDLLIGARIHFAQVGDPNLPYLAELDAVLSEWISGRSYADRIANLRDGSSGANRRNGNIFLTANTTVLDDSSPDSLTGGTSQDWFFARASGHPHDDILSRDPGEILDELF